MPLVFALVALPAALLYGQGLEKPLDATIEFGEKAFDFGFMPKGTSAMHTYEIRNTGTDTLRILRVKPSCGCTSAPLSSSDIGPNDNSQMDVFFDSKRFQGKITKKISILSNDPKDPFVDVSFTAMVDKQHPFIEPKPFVVEADRVEGGSYNVRLTNKSEEPFELELISVPDGYLKAQLSRTKIEPGKSADLNIKLLKDYVGVAKPWYSVTLQTNDPQGYRLTIPIKLPEKSAGK